MAQTAAKTLVETLRRHGVDRAFCVPGESYLAVMDALVDDPIIDIVSCRHEGGAAFMAVADAKCTGRPGVVFASRGPGATNASVAIHSAHQGGVPLVVMLGQVGTKRIGMTHTQEMDFSKTFADMAKSVEQVDDPNRIGEITARAFHIAQSGTPGPVIVALPTNVLEAMTEATAADPLHLGKSQSSEFEIAAIIELLNTAERPVLIAGEQTGKCRDTLAKVAEMLEVPVMPVFEHEDVFDHDHPLYAGELGIRPPMAVRQTIWDADVILAIGTRLTGVPNLGYTVPGENQRFVHIHPDPAEIGMRFRTDGGIVAETEMFLESISLHLESISLHNVPPPPASRRAWADRAHKAYTDAASLPVRYADDGIDFAHVIDAMNELLPRDAVITSDAGNFASWLHHRFNFRRTNLLIGSEVGAMGMGIPAAIAASLRFPDQQVFGLVGDGGALMTGSELATAMLTGAKPRIIVSNNQHYGTIRYHQEVHFPTRDHPVTTLRNPDFAAYAAAFGAKGLRILRPEDAVPVIAEAMKHDGPVVIEVRTSLELNTSQTRLSDLQAKA
jgi:acetolactate synthase-1/2/3 large subunit